MYKYINIFIMVMGGGEIINDKMSGKNIHRAIVTLVLLILILSLIDLVFLFKKNTDTCENVRRKDNSFTMKIS